MMDPVESKTCQSKVIFYLQKQGDCKLKHMNKSTTWWSSFNINTNCYEWTSNYVCLL